ncbi:BNR repeat-containing protein [Flavobacterium alvei]|uniref:BNR repeat-containing protein n=1 Tax=Flavobacterium alvei TaxID=2080416 RepID=UPI0026EF69C8|nr:BNR repeat-containing protein [Flavobacterium alvei]
MKNNKIIKGFLFSLLLFLSACTSVKMVQTDIGLGWNNNSVNTVKFRKNAVTTHLQYQFTAYYDENSCLILAKRKVNSSDWEKVKTSYKGNTKDAHNDISIAIDGDGFLHVSWDHHDTKLRYAKSIKPLSLELGEEQPMTSQEENKVTYPQFYNLPNGNLLFFYRSGTSGRGNMVINSYDLKSGNWSQLQRNLLDGEEKRSAYWQSSIDQQGVIHLSWVWRESWDVSTNHDMCYARSKDGGITWEKSSGEKYKLPITVSTAEIAWKIPQKSSLINQTAMATDKNGNPYIATYWSENKIPQFQIIYLKNGNWKKINTEFRKTPFYLGGGGTKQIPISRPDVFIANKGNNSKLYLLFRDEERGNKISLAYIQFNKESNWKIVDLTNDSVGQWEPNYDISLWEKENKLHIFMQNVTQIDGEGLAKIAPSNVSVLEVNHLPK